MATALRPAATSRPNSFFSLSRITSSGAVIPEIDGLRFIAIAAVVAFHIYEYLVIRSGIKPHGIVSGMLLHGNRGVPLFFVISGFILGRPFASYYIRGSRSPELKEYYLRRLTRLEPPYLIAITSVFWGLASFSINRGFPHLLASLVYSHNLIYGAPNPFFGLAWSLEIEVQFYCLIPLLACIYMLPRTWRRVVLFAFMFFGAFHLLATPARFNLSILGWIQCFSAGLLLADFYTADWKPAQNWSFDLLSLLLWPMVFFMSEKACWVMLPFIAFILYVSAFRSFWFRRFFTFAAVSTVGGMCYTMYLVHYPMISLAGRIFKGATIITLASSALIVAASLLFFVFIERPCMDKHWPEKLYLLSSHAKN